MRRIVVVGASLAGLRAAEAARRLGFDGELTLVGDEPHAPYDRPPLSKELLRGAWGPERLALRPEGLDGLNLTLRSGAAATGLDLRRREVLLGSERLPFDGLVIATGARARRLPGQPALRGVHTLRTLEDALAIRRALTRRPKLAVVGAGFIGLEVASSARALGLEVTVVEPLAVPLAPRLGDQMGRAVAQLHRDHGVTLRLGAGVSQLVGEGAVTELILDDGTRVEADLVVLGVGVRPNTEWLEGAGLRVEDGLVCDAHCRALDARGEPAPGVVAAGDVARWYNPLFEASMRVEHWTHAAEQAEHAVRTLLEPEALAPFAPAPLFWSDQHGVKIQFVGHAHPGDTLHVCHGSVAQGRFVALYGRQGRLVGALGFRRPAQIIRYRQQIAARAAFEDVVGASQP